MDDSNTLDLLLEKAGKYHPQYGGGLATHLPMVIIALDRLNAPENKLEHVFDDGIKGLDLIGGLGNINAVQTIAYNLGDSKSFNRYLKYFRSELSLHGIEVVIKKSLPRLIYGVAASAFHALIRLAYAIEANSQSEVAIALAYWSAEFQSFELSLESSNESLPNILTRLAPIGVNHQFSPGIIVNRMAEIGEVLKGEKCIILPSSITLTKIKRFVLKAFYDKNNFTVLHTVTACHAFSIVMPYLDKVDIALQELWKAILIAYLSTGLEYDDNEVKISEGNVDFPSVINVAVESKDAHVIKLVYTCLYEYMECRNPLYYIVAKRAVTQ